MSVELVRRLVEAEVVSTADVEAALLDAAEDGEHFLRALVRRSAEAQPAVERLLEARGVPALRLVRPVPELLALLPPSCAERLLAVPVRRDPVTGTVDVVCADARDPHVAAELEWQLGAPVRILQAALGEVLRALDEVHEIFDLRARTPAFGSRVLGASAAGAGVLRSRASVAPEPAIVAPSEPPIPLVRTRDSLAPRAPTAPLGVFDLAPERPLEHALGDAGRATPAEPSEALARLGEAERPDQVVEALVAGVAVVAPRVVVLSSRGAGYEGRAASNLAGDAEHLRAFRVGLDESPVLRVAIDSGYFLGCLPLDPAHIGLAVLLGADTREEIYLAPVAVGGRAALIVAAAGFEVAHSASRAIDALARAASEALGRIVRARRGSIPPPSG
ncbi:MAG: hypothetical protein IT376_09475 [Polyangiaceae bacterium]|nr:hypothetical protein [Polyangiaceae bacterium]